MTTVCSRCGAPHTPRGTGKNRRMRCGRCLARYQREWRQRNPNHEREVYQRTKVESRERSLLRKYAISLVDYDRMLAAQGGKCAICGAPESAQRNRVLHVDHCHATGRVRGLLCRGCNHMLGHVKDDATAFERAAGYLAGAR